MIRLGALGDVVRTLPAFASLRARYPHAHLAWLVERAAESVVRSQPGVDEVIVFPREELEASLAARRPLTLALDLLRFVRALRKRRFDLVLDFHSILKSGVISFLSGAPIRVGYDRPFSREGAWRFTNRRVQIEPRRVSRFVRNAALVDFLGIGLPTVPAVAGRAEGAHDATGSLEALALPPESAAALRMDEALTEMQGCAPIVLHPGSSTHTRYKRYPAPGWGEVASQLALDGERCIVSSGPDEAERALAREVVAASAGAAVLAPETPTLEDLRALFARCKLFLGSDSGPLHVASLVGTPVVQLLGPTDPTENAPFPATPSRQLQVPMACSPCRRGCRSAPCMHLLPPAAVVAAARELLAAGRDHAEGSAETR